MFAAALSLAGCAHAPSPVTDRDRLTVALSSDIRGTEPGTRRDANTDTVMMHVFEGLVAAREDGTPGPLLAKSIDVSADGRHYVFTLRDGMRFSNGAPLTAREVVWSWHRYLDPATGWLCLPGFDGSKGARVEQVTATGAMTIAFTLDRSDPLLLARMASVECGGSAIVHPSSLDADGKWRAPVATGPYRIAAWRKGEYLDLVANPLYASRGGARDGFTGGKSANVRQLRFYVIRDSESRMAAFAKGQLDVLSDLGGPDVRQIRRVAGTSLVSAPVAGINAILIRADHAPLNDVRVRRALAMAIDRRAIAALATGATGRANASVVPVASPFHTALHDAALRYDPAAARALLAQTAYRGEPITMVTTRRYVDVFDQALIVQAMARKVGLNIRLEVLDWATQLNRYQSGEYQLMSFLYSARADPYLSYDAMLGDQHVSKRKVWGDRAAIALLRTAGEAGDRAQRQAAFDALHRMMVAQTPMIVLFNAADLNATRKGIAGYRSWMLETPRLWNVTKAGGHA